MDVSLEVGANDVDGVWVDYPGQEGVKLKVARAGNPEYLKEDDKLRRPFRKQIRQGKLSPQKDLEIQCKGMGKAILVGWEGLTNGGKDLEWTPENAYLVLRHNPEIREFVYETAVDHDNYRQEEIKKTAKKSSSS